MTKRFADSDLKDACFAHVPDEAKGEGGSKSLRKLKLCSDDGELDSRIIGAAAAAVGPGYRGERVDLSPEDMKAAKTAIRKAWKSANPDEDEADMPEGIREASEPRIAADDEERPTRAYLSALWTKIKELAGTAISREDFESAHKSAMSSAGGKASAAAKQKAKMEAADARAHAERHPESVQGCDYCGPYVDVQINKLAKGDERVHYRDAVSDPQSERCGMCRFYQWGQCSLIEGTIEYDYLCDLYLAGPKVGPTMAYNVSDLCAVDGPIHLFIELKQVS